MAFNQVNKVYLWLNSELHCILSLDMLCVNMIVCVVHMLGDTAEPNGMQDWSSRQPDAGWKQQK